MAELDTVRIEVRRHLKYNYLGNENDVEGDNDGLWINKREKYEVDYAIAKCLCDCNASKLAKSTTVIQQLEEKIQSMDHDGQGRCKREMAYAELKKLIISIWLLANSKGQSTK